MPLFFAGGNTGTTENVGLLRGEMYPSTDNAGRARDLLILDCPALRGLRKVDGAYVTRALGWDDLLEAVKIAAPSSAVVVQPFAEPGETRADSRLTDLLDAARLIPVVAVVPFQSAYTGAVRTMLDQGVTDVADATLELTPAGIRPRLHAVHAQPLKQLVEPALSRFVSANARTIIRAAAEVTVDGGTAVDLGDVFRSTERTVSGWGAREALPQPRRLLAWLRLVLALALLEAPHRSVARAAMGAGYSFDYALRRAIKDMLGGTAPPRERTVTEALNAFSAELRTLRDKRRKQGRADEE
jgi:hypothetical protein